MIHKLILGTVQFGLNYGINNKYGLMPNSEVNAILKLATQEGIIKIDTAADYGESEKRIGDFHKGDTSFDIITKFSKKINFNWKDSLNISLHRLQVNSVDTVLFHSFSSYMESKPILKKIIHEGKGNLFKQVGVSVYTSEELDAVADDELIDVVQSPFNMLDNSFQREHNLKKLKELGKIVHTRSVFLQGLFFMEPNKLPKKLSFLSTYCLSIRSIARNANISIGHLALQYALSKQYIDGVLIGVDTVEQLRTNVQWAKTPISSSILTQIDQIQVSDPTLLNPSKW